MTAKQKTEEESNNKLALMSLIWDSLGPGLYRIKERLETENPNILKKEKIFIFKMIFTYVKGIFGGIKREDRKTLKS